LLRYREEWHRDSNTRMIPDAIEVNLTKERAELEARPRPGTIEQRQLLRIRAHWPMRSLTFAPGATHTDASLMQARLSGSLMRRISLSTKA